MASGPLGASAQRGAGGPGRPGRSGRTPAGVLERLQDSPALTAGQGALARRFKKDGLAQDVLAEPQRDPATTALEQPAQQVGPGRGRVERIRYRRTGGFIGVGNAAIPVEDDDALADGLDDGAQERPQRIVCHPDPITPPRQQWFQSVSSAAGLARRPCRVKYLTVRSTKEPGHAEGP